MSKVIRMAPENEQKWDALRRAGDLQKSLLAERCPDCDCMDVAVLYEPAHRVGGDFYDILPVGDRKRLILIGDVVGHEVASGLVMAMILGFISGALTGSTTPCELLKALNAYLLAHSKRVGMSNLITTLFVGELDIASLTMTYACAGHPLPLVQIPSLRQSSTLTGGGMILGVEGSATWSNCEVSFNHGDRLLLYTDGLTDGVMPSGERPGTDRLCAILDEKIDADATVVIEHTRAELYRSDADDDCTLVVLTFNGHV